MQLLDIGQAGLVIAIGVTLLFNRMSQRIWYKKGKSGRELFSIGFILWATWMIVVLGFADAGLDQPFRRIGPSLIVGIWLLIKVREIAELDQYARIVRTNPNNLTSRMHQSMIGRKFAELFVSVAVMFTYQAMTTIAYLSKFS